jgi:lipoate-protein ligase A
MASGVETFTSLGMTETLFSSLRVFRDIDSRSAALNMAIDEALLETAAGPTLRFYRWDHPALSFGYFNKFDDVASRENERDIVRRWTGGGIVFHGEDLTYSIVIPASDSPFGESSMSIYEKTHAAIRAALVSDGRIVELVAGAADSGCRNKNDSAIRDRRYSECFANPVRADVLLNGCKIAGAAQRRTRRGLLQQGSIQNVDLGNDFAECFAGKLSNERRLERLSDALLARARAIAEQKYSTAGWLRRR